MTGDVVVSVVWKKRWEIVGFLHRLYFFSCCLLCD